VPWANTVAFDRLARSTRDLLNTLATITAKRAGLAEFERELNRTRTGEGRERAKANGVRLYPHASSAARGDQAPQGR
jgi:DNA invertase Pin-like site-specific DNA recombinase